MKMPEENPCAKLITLSMMILDKTHRALSHVDRHKFNELNDEAKSRAGRALRSGEEVVAMHTSALVPRVKSMFLDLEHLFNM